MTRGPAMKGRRAAALLVWAGLMVLAVWVLARAQYSTDLSAFLPQAPTGAQRLLVEQLRQGVASRLIIVGIQGADDAERARLSRQMAARLRADPEFLAVENGDAAAAQRDEAFLFAHRYVLSEHGDAAAIQRRGVEGGHRRYHRCARLAHRVGSRKSWCRAIRRAR